MEITNTLYVKDRTEFRKWLEKNFEKEKEIWLIYYKKNSSKPRIPYNDAVEEALCFGWIDSIVKKIDDEKYAQRFTPRKLNSKWSDLNILRVKKLIAEGKMTQFGLSKIKELNSLLNKKPRTKNKILKIPVLIKNHFEKNKKAWEFFVSLSPSYKQMYIEWITSAKKEETKLNRIKKAITLLEKKQKLGMA